MVEMPADTTHLEAFRKVVAKLDPDSWLGDDPSAFARRYGIDPQGLPNCRQDRLQTRGLLAPQQLPISHAAVAILAWGRMKKPNADKFFAEDRPQCLAVAEQVRSGSLDRQASYAAFRNVRSGAGMPGLGPAYFTKLIHFLQPAGASPKAHILDQWAGMSVNLMWKEAVVPMQRYTVRLRRGAGRQARRVSDDTTPAQYEDFCKRVDWLSNNLSASADAIDQAFLSKAGNPNWRHYLLNKYPNLF